MFNASTHSFLSDEELKEDNNDSFTIAYTLEEDEEIKYLHFLLGADDKYVPNPSFQSIFRRTINNSEQLSVFEKYLDATCKICKFLLESGEVNNPASYLWSVLDNKHELFPMSTHSHIYLEESSNKIGKTSNSIGREKYNVKEFAT